MGYAEMGGLRLSGASSQTVHSPGAARGSANQRRNRDPVDNPTPKKIPRFYTKILGFE
jgi:hypothetical protein